MLPLCWLIVYRRQELTQIRSISVDAQHAAQKSFQRCSQPPFQDPNDIFSATRHGEVWRFRCVSASTKSRPPRREGTVASGKRPERPDDPQESSTKPRTASRTMKADRHARTKRRAQRTADGIEYCTTMDGFKGLISI